MMNPDILTVPNGERIGLAYVLRWEEGVEIKMERLYQHRDYHVDAEITVLDHQQPNPHLVGPQRASITKTFRSLIKELEEESGRSDWGKRLKQASIKVLGDFRSGDPTIKLNEMPPPEMPPWRVTGVSYEGVPTVIYSSGGMGKSTFGVAMLTLIQAGIGIPDLFGVTKGNCLVLDYEASWAETYRRSADVVRAYSLPDDSMVWYRFMSAPLHHEAEAIRRQVDELDIDVVLVDSAGPACGGEPESAPATINYFNALRSLSSLDHSVTTITLAHVTKDKKSVDGPFGSVYWTNLPRSTYELTSERKAGENYLDCSLVNRKTNMGTLQEALGFRMTWDGERGLFLDALDLGEHPILSEKLDFMERVKRLIEDEGPQTLDEIIQKLNPPKPKSVSPSLSRSKAFETIGGKWQLGGLSY